MVIKQLRLLDNHFLVLPIIFSFKPQSSFDMLMSYLCSTFLFTLNKVQRGLTEGYVRATRRKTFIYNSFNHINILTILS